MLMTTMIAAALAAQAAPDTHASAAAPLAAQPASASEDESAVRAVLARYKSAIDIGVNRYLGKPYQEHELLRNVFELLAQVRADEGVGHG